MTKKKQKDMKSTIMWIVIGTLALLVIYAVFFKDANVVSKIASSGQSAQSASSAMVGGC